MTCEFSMKILSVRNLLVAFTVVQVTLTFAIVCFGERFSGFLIQAGVIIKSLGRLRSSSISHSCVLSVGSNSPVHSMNFMITW